MVDERGRAERYRAVRARIEQLIDGEIVVPVIGPTGEVLAVLDVDSDQEAAFDDVDQAELEGLCRELGARFPKGELRESTRVRVTPSSSRMGEAAPFLVRALERRDRDGLLAMWRGLWPEEEQGEHAPSVDARLDGNKVSTLPLQTFVAESSRGQLVGFAEVGLRSHADGCDARTPVAFLEGWYVAPEWRRRGVGRALVQRAEQWGREQGAIEMASDTWHDAAVSEAAHRALGFELVDRCINFAKRL